MKPMSKTRPTPSWERMTREQQNLLARLCLESLDGLVFPELEPPSRRAADALLALGIVEYRDLVVRVTDAGVRLFVRESGLFGRQAG